MTMPKFVLFDIDHTLIDSGGAGIAALNKALQKVAGISQGFNGINCAGKTDLQIVREAFDVHRVKSRNGLIDEMMEEYVIHLRIEVRERNGHVKPGVGTLLARLDEEEDLFLGLLTGNLEQGARVKLAPYGLNRYFPVGAFGSDSEDRNLLLPVAVKRLAALSGVALGYDDCVVIGDTPRDVVCARAHHAASIAVATGPYSLKRLEEAAADLVVPDLTQTERIVQWIKSGS